MTPKKTFTAKTIEEAKEMAAAEFGVAQERINFEIIEEPKKTLFGKTKGEAIVSACYEETKTDLAANYIVTILRDMGIADAKAEPTEIENGVMLEITGTGFEELIGKKGEILDSLQYLASLICNKIDREYFRISVDSYGFRASRKVQLEELAKKIAENVKRNGRTSALEPMNPYERRIIHATVSEIEGVTSRSVGEEPYRKVLVSSTEKKPFDRNNDRRGGGYKGNNRRGGNGGNRRPPRPQKSFDITTSFEKDYKKPKPEDSLDLGSGLYSKIEF